MIGIPNDLTPCQAPARILSDVSGGPNIARRTSEPHATEEYLAAIYELEEEGVRVVQARIAARLGLSRASVSEQVARLGRMKLVRVEGRTIALTEHGRTIAEDTVRRHRMAERFLTDVLKMPWHKAHDEASRFQGAISEEVERRITALLGGPATCPHGNPIPGTGARTRRDLKPLNQFAPGKTVVLERMTEDVELHTDALWYFERNGLVPGARLRVTEVSPDGTMSLEVGRRRPSLGPKLADNLWVRPAGDGKAGGAARHRAPARRRRARRP